MEVNEVLLDILNEVRKISSEQSSTNAKLEACVKMTDRQEEDIKALQITDNEVHKHGVILKGMLWVYGIIFSGVLVKYIASKVLS